MHPDCKGTICIPREKRGGREKGNDACGHRAGKPLAEGTASKGPEVAASVLRDQVTGRTRERSTGR